MLIWKKEELPFDLSNGETLFISLFAVGGFFILGLFINSDQVVFTYTYYWFFSFFASLLAAFAVLRFKDSILRHFTWLFIASAAFLLVGTLLLDYSPVLVNRSTGTGIFVEHQLSINGESMAVLSWSSVNVPNDSNYFIDMVTWKLASTYYDSRVSSKDWYNRNFYTDPIGTARGIRGKYDNMTNYVLINDNFFLYPSTTFGRKLPLKYKPYYHSFGNNLIYSNGYYEIIKLA
jgi:hypothetical protein